ncbi:MAG TPA: hypothetical protein VGC30_08260, partial [Dokdonella sp.]
WGEAKRRLFERIDAELAPMRERYEALIAKPDEIEQRLREGARKARARSAPFVAALRWAAGIRGLADVGARGDADAAHGAAAAKPAPPQLKSYREADGRFYFKLTGGDGALLLQSRAFGSPKDAGRLAAALVDAGDAAEPTLAALLGEAAADAPAELAPIRAALAALKAEKLAKQRANA